MDENKIGLRELEELTGLSRQTLVRHCQSGKIAAEHIGKAWLADRAAVLAQIERGELKRGTPGRAPGANYTSPHELRKCANPACTNTFNVLTTSTRKFCGRACMSVVKSGGADITLAEAGQILGVSRERVRQYQLATKDRGAVLPTPITRVAVEALAMKQRGE